MWSWIAYTKIEFWSSLIAYSYDVRLGCQSECENYILSVLPEQSS